VSLSGPLKNIQAEEAYRIWALSMSRALQADRKGDIHGIPVAVNEKTPISNRAAMMIACGLGLVLALLCFGMYSLTAGKLQSIAKEIEQLDQQKKQLSAQRRSLAASQKQLSAQQQTLGDLQTRTGRIQSNLARATQMRQFQQTRWLELITAIAKSHHDGLWIRGMNSDGHSVTVLGMAINNKDVTQFTSKLESYASPHGWIVHPAQTESKTMALVEFKIKLNVSDRVAPSLRSGANYMVVGDAESNRLAER
ncbi:MAG: PilN domain-containing protein, partial [Planctomycetota bacterium]